MDKPSTERPQKMINTLSSENSLSYSSANVYRACEQKFVNYKRKIPKDKDSKDSTTALDVGSSFHYINERTNHTKENITKYLKEAKNIYKLEKNTPLVHGLVLKYTDFHERSKITIICVELPVGDEFITGFIDAIGSNSKGAWWIIDLKTTSYISDDLYVKVLKDPQLLLYSHFAEYIAKHLGLDIKKFKGCLYRTTSKPRFTWSEGEKYTDVVRRVYQMAKVMEIFIPYDRLLIGETVEEHLRIREHGLKLIEGKIKPQRNYTSCFDFFRPCDYISQCYGKTYTEIIKESKNQKVY